VSDAEEAIRTVSRLIAEIRRDASWREAVDKSAQTIEESAPASRTTPGLVAPKPDPQIDATLNQATAAADAADAVVPIVAGTPVVGEVWAALRRQVHADIRIYQDRQSAFNHEILAALRHVQRALEPAAPESALGAAWAGLATIVAAVTALEDRVRRLSSIDVRLANLEQAVEALNLELEPLNQLRVTVDEISRRTMPA